MGNASDARYALHREVRRRDGMAYVPHQEATEAKRKRLEHLRHSVAVIDERDGGTAMGDRPCRLTCT